MHGKKWNLKYECKTWDQNSYSEMSKSEKIKSRLVKYTDNYNIIWNGPS